MISPKEFKQLWLEEWSPLHAYGEEAVRNLPFSDSTKEFLVASGLPESCAPFLSFNRTLPNQSIKTIKEEYNLEHDDFINYYVIGDGDNVSICIDTNREDQIFEIDFHYVYDVDAREDTDYHEDYRPIIFMNTSIRHLAHCVLVYRHFIDEIRSARNGESYLTINPTAEELSSLEANLLQADPYYKESSRWSNF